MAAICAATHFRDDSKQGGLGYAEEWLVENWKVGKGQYGGLAKGTLIKRVLGLKTVEECREAAVVLLALNVFTSFYQPGAEENFKAACEWAGFDLDGRLKELLAEKKKGKAAPEAKLKITRSKDPKKFGLNEHGACTKPNRYDVIFPKKTKCHATVLTALVGKNWQAASDAGVHGQGDNDWNMSGLPGDRPGGFKTEAEAVIAEFESLRNEYVNVGKRGHAESEYGGQMLTALCKRLPELLNAKGVGAPAKATGGAATKKKKAGKKK